ncbi:MAG: 3-hydroxyacyl-CoA dehydrogenase NAD-binding domain-containing protein [Flammeovirgaceae bacterium]|nr:3-hydroxyacyl-CoA dehydrogenase NAD-binding domain-containing protein [Flammeovirgaceae bacterium]
MNVESIKKVAVVGAGTMGQGIAQVCAQAGFSVILFDLESSLTDKALLKIKESLVQLVSKNKITAQQQDDILSRIEATNDLHDLQAEIVIEAVIEKLEAKQKIFSALEGINNNQSIFTTNTSSIPVTQIASGLRHAERFAGLHFFNPAPVMKLVEVIRGVATNESTVTLLKDFCKKIGKTSVEATDSPGFIVNRVARHFYVESLKALEENVTTHEGIDQLMKNAGFKMGPFELMDLIGVDVNFSVTNSVYNGFHQDGKFRPSRIQQQKVDAGHYGRKSGKGFYEYPKK